MGVVILCCAEHGDDEAFKREVLLNEEFGRVLREKNVAVWAGDVRDREAYQGESLKSDEMTRPAAEKDKSIAATQWRRRCRSRPTHP